MLRSIFLILLAFGSSTLTAQMTITGTVVNETDGTPLPYVHVFLKSEQSHGVITNETGQYSIQISANQQVDQLVFSQLGYQTHFVSIKQLEGGLYNLKMERSFIALEEIIVTSDLGLRNIIRRALRAIPQNYGHSDYIAQAYYRQYTMTNDSVSQYVDGFISYRDKAYDNPARKAKGWVDHFRASDNFRHPRFKGDNPDYNSMLGQYERFNPIRKHQLNWLVGALADEGSDGLKDMPFHNRGEYLEGGDTLIRIVFDYFPIRAGEEAANPGVIKRYLMQGEVLINLTDYAILRITSRSNQEEDMGLQDEMVYRKYQGKYYPELIRWNFGFNHEYGTQRHYVNQLLYFYNYRTTKAEMKAYKKGKLMLHEQAFDPKRIPYVPEFWANNEMLLRVPAPEMATAHLNRTRSLEEQFRSNARRVVE